MAVNWQQLVNYPNVHLEHHEDEINRANENHIYTSPIGLRSPKKLNYIESRIRNNKIRECKNPPILKWDADPNSTEKITRGTYLMGIIGAGAVIYLFYQTF